MIRKAISAERDRLQSRLMVGCAVPVFAVLICITLRQSAGDTRGLAVAVAISIAFAMTAWRLRAATATAAAFGGAICFLVMLSAKVPGSDSPPRTGLIPLLVLFVLTFGATRLGRQRKVRAGLAESRKGRNAAQVLANLGTGALVCTFAHVIDPSSESMWLAGAISMLAAFVEATADTVSSEIGQAYGGVPRSVLTLRRVAPGTDGAISWIGTLAGVAAGAVVALSGLFALRLTAREVVIALGAGVAGLFLDSLLGATVEMRGWVGNNLVNLSSTTVAALIAWALVR